MENYSNSDMVQHNNKTWIKGGSFLLEALLDIVKYNNKSNGYFLQASALVLW